MQIKAFFENWKSRNPHAAGHYLTYFLLALFFCRHGGEADGMYPTRFHAELTCDKEVDLHKFSWAHYFSELDLSKAY